MRGGAWQLPQNSSNTLPPADSGSGTLCFTWFGDWELLHPDKIKKPRLVINILIFIRAFFNFLFSAMHFVSRYTRNFILASASVLLPALTPQPLHLQQPA